MPRTEVARQPSHAGTWYDSQGELLTSKISGWLEKAATHNGGVEGHARAIIAPHAGYRYCGHIMAHAYKHIDPTQVKRVFLLGPSHHHYTKSCLLSGASSYSTPLGSIPIDEDVYAQLRATKQFKTMDLDIDEAEHSMELHLPYIMYVMRGCLFTLVPIMVGALPFESEAAYGGLLAPFLDDPANLFVISSDFCHWGVRFNYTHYKQSVGAIHESIEWLDRQGMSVIEAQDPEEFRDYLQTYGNTICGRHPIGVLLQALQQCHTKHRVRFTGYDQSSKCLRLTDSSVSYASAVVTAVQA